MKKDITPTLSKHFRNEMGRHKAEFNRKKVMASKLQLEGGTPKNLHVTHKTDAGMYEGDTSTRVVPINGKFSKVKDR
jgi:hypothetical protein